MPLLPQVAMSFVRILYQFWLQQGVPKEALDEVLRIDINDEKAARFGISSEKLAQLHAAANQASADAVMPVRLGKFIAKSELEFAQIMLHAESLQKGLYALIEHSQAVSESGRFILANESEATISLKFTVFDPITFSNLQQDMVFSALIAWIEEAFPNSHQYVHYHFDESIASLEQYRSLLACNLIAGDEVYIEIDHQLLCHTNEKFDQKLFNKGILTATKLIAKRKQRLALYAQVKETIDQCLLAGDAQQEIVATRLGLSVRNLQRRLKEAGSNYQAILDESRETLAINLIRNLELPLYEVAFKVGFTEPSAFYKAFKRWTGKRPGDYRQDVIGHNNLKLSEALSVGE